MREKERERERERERGRGRERERTDVNQLTIVTVRVYGGCIILMYLDGLVPPR